MAEFLLRLASQKLFLNLLRCEAYQHRLRVVAVVSVPPEAADCIALIKMAQAIQTPSRGDMLFRQDRFDSGATDTGGDVTSAVRLAPCSSPDSLEYGLRQNLQLEAD